MYKDTEFAYAVARIRANEAKLLPGSVLESAAAAADYDACLKVFADSSYADFRKIDIDEFLEEKKSDAIKLIYESAPDKKCLDFLVINNDFHNIKALLKGKLTNQNVDLLLLSQTVFDEDFVKKCIESLEFSKLPHELSDIVSTAYELVTTTLDGQLLEIYLDKCATEMSIAFAKESGDEFAKRIALTSAKLKNIKICIRCAKAGKDRDFIIGALSDISGFDNEDLVKSSLSGIEELESFCMNNGFSSLVSALGNSYSLFEKTSDEILLSLIKDAKYTSFGISPLIAYYYGVDMEVKNVRIVLSCKKNGVENDKIMERIRGL